MSEPTVIWVVWIVDNYEGWDAQAYFVNETDAIACRDILRERDHDEVVRSRTKLDLEWEVGDHFNEYEVLPVYIHGSLTEWQAAEKAAKAQQPHDAPESDVAP